MPEPPVQPLPMYRVKPIQPSNQPVEVPSCMYKMKNVLEGQTVVPGRPYVLLSHTMDKVKRIAQKLESGQIGDMEALRVRQEKIQKILLDLTKDIQVLSSKIQPAPLTAHSPSAVVPKRALKSSEISSELNNISELVINVNPSQPPYSLLFLRKLWMDDLNLVIQTYKHSTIVELPKSAQDFVKLVENGEGNGRVPRILIRLIWKEVDNNLELILRTLPIQGETNLLRFLSRIGPKTWHYESFENPIEIDAALDICHLLSRARTKTERTQLFQQLNSKLGKSQWLCQRDQMSIADLAACSVIRSINPDEVNVNLTKYAQRCCSACV